MPLALGGHLQACLIHVSCVPGTLGSWDLRPPLSNSVTCDGRCERGRTCPASGGLQTRGQARGRSAVSGEWSPTETGHQASGASPVTTLRTLLRHAEACGWTWGPEPAAWLRPEGSLGDVPDFCTSLLLPCFLGNHRRACGERRVCRPPQSANPPPDAARGALGWSLPSSPKCFPASTHGFAHSPLFLHDGWQFPTLFCCPISAFVGFVLISIMYYF